MHERKVLGYEEANNAVKAIINHVKKQNGLPVSIAVVDDRGDLILLVRMDDTSLNSCYMATIKAYTAAKLRHDTSALKAWMEEMDINLADWGDNKLTTIPGGVCVGEKWARGVTYVHSVIGAIGVSGRPTGSADEEIARVGLTAIN